MESDVPKRKVFAVSIDYAGTHHDLLDISGAERLRSHLASCGFQPAADGIDDKVARSEPRAILDAIRDWARGASDGPSSSRADVLVLFLSGHGRVHNLRHYVLAAPSPKEPPFDNDNAIRMDDIAERLLNSEPRACIVLIDGCQSGFGANELADWVRDQSKAQGLPPVRLGVLASSLPLERSSEGVFVEHLLNAIREGSESNRWRPGTEEITLLELCDELRDRLGDFQYAFTAGNDGLKLPNPNYRADMADRPVLLGDLLADLPADEREHFLDKASVSDASEIGWFFTGRRGPTRRLLQWLKDHDQGLYVVTGPPGAGKSAFLGHLAVLADTGSQAACRALGLLDDRPELLPTPGLFDAVVHARQLDTSRVAISLAQQLGIDVQDANRPEVALRQALMEADRSVTVLIDAIDEAARGHEDGLTIGIVRALAGVPRCRVVVGTRRDRSGTYRPGADSTSVDRYDHGPLIDAMIPATAEATVDDLGDDEGLFDDLVEYVDSKLASSWPSEARRQIAGRVVAGQADGIFLYARFAVKSLEGQDERIVDQPGWERRLPSDAGSAGLRQVFDDDLERYSDDAGRIRELLRALAFARGRGLPQRQIWPALATELANPDLGGSGRIYTERDIGYAIREAAWYLIEASVDGEATFRLYHQAIADALREELIDGQ
ncbi:MAG: hypothetical protein WBM50_10065 [Acidimicrobiales bacterium]